MIPSAIPPGIHGIDLELIAADAGDIWFPLLDHVMRDHIRSAGTWEADIGRVLCETFPENGGVFLDIGANVGYFSMLIAKTFPTATIHAFEPHPLTYQVLQLNTWKFGDRIRTWPCALGDHRGTVALNTAVNNLGDTKGVVATDGLMASTVAPIISLDELLGDICADVVKIDVQGAELAVLAGMREFIRRSSGIRIVMEFSPGLLRTNHVDPASVLASLRGMGFTLNLIRPDAFIETSDREILDFCHSAGPMGQANLLLSSCD